MAGIRAGELWFWSAGREQPDGGCAEPGSMDSDALAVVCTCGAAMVASAAILLLAPEYRGAAEPAVERPPARAGPQDAAATPAEGELHGTHAWRPLATGSEANQDEPQQGAAAPLARPLSLRRLFAGTPAASSLAGGGWECCSHSPKEGGSPSAASSACSRGPKEDEEEELGQCKICMGTAEDGKLISPCLCKGSMRYVHVECLDRWRRTAANQANYLRCGTCGYQYRVLRPWLGETLAKWYMVYLMTAFVLFLCMLLAGYVGKIFALCGLRWWNWYSEPAELEAQGWRWVLSPFCADHWVAGASMVGVAAYVISAWHLPVQVLRAPPRTQESGLEAMIFAIVVLTGLLRSFYVLHGFVKGHNHRWLSRMPEIVLEVA